jgi:DNA polymerase-1
MGFVETVLGRRRYFPELKSNNRALKSFAERAAINAPLQGSSADLIKLAMLQVDQEFPGLMILQIHDELLLEVPENQVESLKPRLKQIMESVFSLKVPLVASVCSGANWGEAH